MNNNVDRRAKLSLSEDSKLKKPFNLEYPSNKLISIAEIIIKNINNAIAIKKILKLRL